ncbi:MULTISPECIES: sensor histidine kinase [unclassified Janthinobacterium]|uniref:sensor histidine kinase n=1 Tax=unclassified Janthinobacterium TaxID=2610881 RepID=UPI000348C231|nr:MULTISPECIES: sensor histidine kinase [unclassified Janthinobacterium]MEC5163905.1 two-component system sensor histidine kinase TctE [Janthinobacterium sp. CG_S6]
MATTSIRMRLLKWLIGPILLLNLAGGALIYALAWMPAQSAFDQGLQDAAGALGARLGADAAGVRIDLPRQAEQVLRGDAVDAVYFVVRGGDGRAIAGDADFPPLRRGGAAGAAAPVYDGAVRGEPVRIVAALARVGGHEVGIGVAKTLRKRLQARAATVRALVLLEALFTLASVGLIWFSVTNGLRPLNRMRADLNGRGGDDLAPLEAGQLPGELAPVLRAFNGLLERMRDGARAQHDFLANVAHQLRTPLAGLRSQLEWLEKRPGAEPDTANSIRLMLLSTERMIRQTNQLLALARAEPSHFEKTRLEPLALERLVEESIQYFVEEAAKKAIDLGFDLRATTVRGDRFLLRDLIDNLVDNAIRYTPAGGVVTVGCRPDGAGGLLTVEDSGPGIAPDKRELVFSRFVRLDDKSTGSGLGLAIVRDIALAHGAAIAIDAAPGAGGMLLSVRFPA